VTINSALPLQAGHVITYFQFHINLLLLLSTDQGICVLRCKLFHCCFISHVTASETEIKVFQPPKERRNYFKIVSATLNTLENIPELQ